MTKNIVYLIIAAAIFVLFISGWVMNVISLAQSYETFGMLFLRAIGIFIAPLGAVLGYV